MNFKFGSRFWSLYAIGVFVSLPFVFQDYNQAYMKDFWHYLHYAQSIVQSLCLTAFAVGLLELLLRKVLKEQ